MVLGSKAAVCQLFAQPQLPDVILASLTMAIQQVKHAVFEGFKGAGGFRILQNSRWREQKLLILADHSTFIEAEHQWDLALYTPQSFFRSRMEALRTIGCKRFKTRSRDFTTKIRRRIPWH
jgi:hypothetical protein